MLHILKRVEHYEYARFGVRSAFAHANYPGRILVEVASSVGVVGVCNGIPHVFASKWKVVPREATSQYLNLSNHFIPSPSSWIKLQRRGYFNDIGYVSSIQERVPEVIVVPRIVYERAGKRKRGPIPKERFNVAKAKSSSERLELRNQLYKFKGQSFSKCVEFHTNVYMFIGQKFSACGYLFLSLENSCDYTHTEIFPSLTQLEEFRACELIPNHLMAQFIARANAPLLNVGDRVRINAGDLKGALAEVLTVRDADMDVFVFDDGICITIANQFVQKHFRVGNQVIVKSGAHKNIVGWVVAVDEDTLTVADDANKTVGLFISTLFLPLILADSNKFAYYLQMLTSTRPISPSLMPIPTSPWKN